jgi:hypothetical protein
MCVYMTLGVPLTHRRLLRREAGQWFAKDVGLAAVAALLVVGLARALPLPLGSPKMAVLSLLVVLIVALLAAALAAPLIRAQLLAQLAMVRSASIGDLTAGIMGSISHAADPIISKPPEQPK